jgi:hypothetical protein
MQSAASTAVRSCEAWAQSKQQIFLDFRVVPLANSEVARLGKRGASCRVGYGVRVSSKRVNGPSAVRLCCKQPAGADAKCLPGCKCEPVSYG